MASNLLKAPDGRKYDPVPTTLDVFLALPTVWDYSVTFMQYEGVYSLVVTYQTVDEGAPSYDHMPSGSQEFTDWRHAYITGKHAVYPYPAKYKEPR